MQARWRGAKPDGRWAGPYVVGCLLGIGLAAACTAQPIPPLAAGAPPIGAARSQTGVLVAVLATFDGGTWVRTPCYGVTVLREVTPVGPVDVLLDPGHGGSEDGAIGPNGLKEKEVNLAVATRVKVRLEAKGRTVAMTRDVDLRSPIRTRAELAVGLGPRAFVSIHHNATGPPPRKGRPGTEVFHQAASEPSRRLAQALWDSETAALARFDIEWSADDNNPGPRFRIGDDGDYYGVLRYAAGIPSVISEAAFITSPAEAELMATDAFRDTEADAIATAIDRFLAADGATGAARIPSTASPAIAATSPTTEGTMTEGTTTEGSVVAPPPPAGPAAPAASSSTTAGLPARPPDVDDCTDPPLE